MKLEVDLSALDALKPILLYPLWQRVVAVAAVGIVLVMGYWYFFWLPAQERLHELDTAIAEQLKTFEKNQKIAAELALKKREYQKLVKDLRVTLEMLPKKSQIDELLAGVSWAGKDAGLEFSAFEPREERIREIYAEVPVAIAVHGSFKQLMSFLKRVGEMPRIVDVKHLVIVPAGSGRGLNIQGEVVTYRFIGNPSPPADGVLPQGGEE